MTARKAPNGMASRVAPRDGLDDFPTPCWATRALLRHLDPDLFAFFDMTVREPAANRGYMVRPLAEAFGNVEASDIHDYGAGFPVRDCLAGPLPDMVDWTITNPPFVLADKFIARAAETSRAGFAMLLRVQFLEGGDRLKTVFGPMPPAVVAPFAERVPILKGQMSPRASTTMAYAWFIWRCQEGQSFAEPRTVVQWIAPCRRALELPGDYFWGGA